MSAPSTSQDVRSFTVADDDDGIRLDRWFKRHLPEANFNIVSRWTRSPSMPINGTRSSTGETRAPRPCCC
jgi:23S rRNA pseudouridine955/2504/2580 synthase